MSEYTPTTDDVALAYIHAVNGNTWVSGKARALQAEFDRWLMQVKAEAWDEGFDAGVDHAVLREFVFNPYSIKSERAQQYIQSKLRDDKHRLTKAKARE